MPEGREADADNKLRLVKHSLKVAISSCVLVTKLKLSIKPERLLHYKGKENCKALSYRSGKNEYLKF